MLIQHLQELAARLAEVQETHYCFSQVTPLGFQILVGERKPRLKSKAKIVTWLELEEAQGNILLYHLNKLLEET